MEKYLDAGAGECLLRNTACAAIVTDELQSSTDWLIDVPHSTIMPNHWHALVVPRSTCTHSLRAIMKRVKGRTGNRLPKTIGGPGPVWQREWFDRWMRNDTEWAKTVAYIRNNPVKAGLVSTWQQHHSTQ